MKNTIKILTFTLLLTGCVANSQRDKSLLPGITKTGDVYSSSSLKLMLGDPVAQAVRQCQSERKELKIIGNTITTGLLSGKNYAVTIFKCQ